MQRFENKYDLLKAAYNDSSLKKSTILLMQYLVHKSNSEQCFPSIDTIAKALNVCKRTVQYNMRKLEKAGYIMRKARFYNHQQLSNQYIFNLGVTEDLQIKNLYTESEKEQFQNSFGESEVQNDISKATEILKIYDMPITSREKLLLIYLYHRANQKGIVYDTADKLMDAIGVSSRMLTKVLYILRRKGFIYIQTKRVSGRKLYLVKLTGAVWKQEEDSREVNKNLNDIDKCSRQIRTTNYMNNKTMKRGGEKKSINYISNIWKKLKGSIQSGLDKIRILLRL